MGPHLALGTHTVVGDTMGMVDATGEGMMDVVAPGIPCAIGGDNSWHGDITWGKDVPWGRGHLLG